MYVQIYNENMGMSIEELREKDYEELNQSITKL